MMQWMLKDLSVCFCQENQLLKRILSLVLRFDLNCPPWIVSHAVVMCPASLRVYHFVPTCFLHSYFQLKEVSGFLDTVKELDWEIFAIFPFWGFLVCYGVLHTESAAQLCLSYLYFCRLCQPKVLGLSCISFLNRVTEFLMLLICCHWGMKGKLLYFLLNSKWSQKCVSAFSLAVWRKEKQET